MSKQLIAILVGCVLLFVAAGFVVSQLTSDSDTPLVCWSQADEQEVPLATDAEGVVAQADGAVERTAVDLEAGNSAAGEARVEVTLRGRVVDKFRAPIAGASVWLDFGRGGFRGGQANRQRRVPDPVQTDREGRFAFQGQTFRNLSVSLHVLHKDHALGLFQKDIGEVEAEVDLGDLVLNRGGELRGRVTDLEGNGIADAELRLQPENANPLRFVRERERMLQSSKTDHNGYFRRANLAAGDWSIAATATRHTEGRSSTFVIEEEQMLDIDDIRLGPGFEVTGYVRTVAGQPIAKAEVLLRAENRGRGGGGRDHRATTDEQGRFSLDHLPGVAMRLEATAEGYLDFAQGAVDPTSGQLLHVAMQDGLRISGTVHDADSSPVALFAVRAIRVRGLPSPGQPEADLNAILSKLREGNLDEATRTQLRTTMENMRGQMGGRGGRGGDGEGPGRGGPDGGGRPARARDLGKPESHPNGTFLATGLQEGIYEVNVQSPEHARYRSAEVEVRFGLNEPVLTIVLDGGYFVAGAVLDDFGAPVRGARVELRSSSGNEGDVGARRRGRGNGQTDGNAPDWNAVGRDWMRLANGAQVTLETTSNAEGLFVVKHAPKGRYDLQAEAKGFATARSEPFDLDGDRSGFRLQVGALGVIAGSVRGLRQGEAEQARVAAVPIGGQQGGMGALFGRGNGGGNPLQGVGVAADGTYRIEGLVPGAYLVRSWIGSPQELMRELAPQFMSGSLTGDATVRGAEVTAHDVTLTRAAVGVVAGSILHNGSPAVGFQVELSRQDDDGASDNDPAGSNGPGSNGPGSNGPGGGGRRGGGAGDGRGMRGGFSRTYQGTVAASGRFTIEGVPAGAYRLRVQNARRGGTLHEQSVQVTANTTTEHNISLMTVSLQGAVTSPEGGNSTDFNGRASLLPGLTAPPEDIGAWQRENTLFNARVQNGTFRFEALQPGSYLLIVTLRGRERTTLPIVVGGADQEVQVAAGKVDAAAGAPTARPGAEAGAASRAGANNRPGGPGAPAAPGRGNRPGGNRR